MPSPVDRNTYQVGQRVWIQDVNGRGRGPCEGRVVKVGRKLFTVEYGYGRAKQFRIENGVVNDDYGHQWVRTDEQLEEDNRRTSVLQRLRQVGIEYGYGSKRLTLDQLERIADIAEG